VKLSDSETLPFRFVAGAEAMEAVEANLRAIKDQIANRELSATLSYDDQ
jgi:hypothetical protein